MRIHRCLCIVLVVLGLACTRSPVAPRPTASDLDVPDFDEIVPKDGLVSDSSPVYIPGSGSFLDLLARQGIQLNSIEIESLRKVMALKPSGKWAVSRNRTEEETLENNFQRFGKMLKSPPANAAAYKKLAIAFASKSNVPYYLDLQYYADTRTLLAVKWDSKTGEFVIIRSDGSLINYLISLGVQAPRYLKIVF